MEQTERWGGVIIKETLKWNLILGNVNFGYLNFIEYYSLEILILEIIETT